MDAATVPAQENYRRLVIPADGLAHDPGLRLRDPHVSLALSRLLVRL